MNIACQWVTVSQCWPSYKSLTFVGVFQQLKLSSLFAAWLFKTFHNKSHNMKALVILSLSWSPFLPLVYMKNLNFCGSLCALLEYFLENHHSHLGWEGFTELFLSNIMKYGKNYVEWKTSIQGMSLSDFWDYLSKKEGSFKICSLHIDSAHLGAQMFQKVSLWWSSNINIFQNSYHSVPIRIYILTWRSLNRVAYISIYLGAQTLSHTLIMWPLAEHGWLLVCPSMEI